MLSNFEGEPSRALDTATLVAILSGMDPNRKIILEGCDCAGYLGGVTTKTEADGTEVTYLVRTV